MKVTKITIGRLYNLGSYEHIRYEISAEVAEGQSAQKALIGLEKILDGLKPETKYCVSSRGELDRESFRVSEMRKHSNELSEDEFRRRYGHFVGTPAEYVGRCEDGYKANVRKRADYEKCARKSRELLDDLGGASQWKDAKLDWEDDNEFQP